MQKYTYEVEFSDELMGESFTTKRTYDEEMAWEDIWQDIVSSGDLQMTFELLEVEEDEE
jgi:hypothetical protein